ncbi:hypothetical protein EFT40_04280 [Lentilactobacillus parabuchneri]|nr:hypothetical protein [Lentilactobacillus parabuchneri]OCB80311.1 hypothetical protein A8O18_05365 [Lentilactobacillus parabuchneri]OCB80610.1 hypothetical protein A7322_05415 [Lentilactobacillus parabuchneri]
MSVASEHVFQGKKKQRSKQPPITSLQKKQKMTAKKKTWPSFLRIYKVMAKKPLLLSPANCTQVCILSLHACLQASLSGMFEGEAYI